MSHHIKSPYAYYGINVATNQIIAESGKVTGTEYQNRETNEVIRKDLESVFVQIGFVPNSRFMEGEIDLSQYAEIVIDECAKASLSAFGYLLLNSTTDQQAA